MTTAAPARRFTKIETTVALRQHDYGDSDPPDYKVGLVVTEWGGHNPKVSVTYWFTHVYFDTENHAQDFAYSIRKALGLIDEPK